MKILSYILAAFSVLGAVDYILNDKFRIGKEWAKGFQLLGTMSLSMIGMIVLAPCIAHVLAPALSALPAWLPFEPSVVAGSFLANDMGGATLALSLAGNDKIGYFNGLVVGAMMGATISFTLPLAMNVVEKRQQRFMLMGLMCGIIAIPPGCMVSGLMVGIPIGELVMDLIPLAILAALLIVGLLKAPDMCVRIFRIFGAAIRVLIVAGLVVGIVRFQTGYELLPHCAPIEEGSSIVFNAAIVMSGAFPLIQTISMLLRRPLRRLGKMAGMNDTSALGFVSTLATNVTTFGMMKDMDDKGVVLNSAFAVSAAFTFAGHLAFTMSFQAEYTVCVIVGKLAAGVLSVIVAWLLVRRMQNRHMAQEK